MSVYVKSCLLLVSGGHLGGAPSRCPNGENTNSFLVALKPVGWNTRVFVKKFVWSEKVPRLRLLFLR